MYEYEGMKGMRLHLLLSCSCGCSSHGLDHFCIMVRSMQGPHIDNTGDPDTIQPAKVLPLATATVARWLHGPVIGQTLAVESKAGLEEMRKLALAVQISCT